MEWSSGATGDDSSDLTLSGLVAAGGVEVEHGRIVEHGERRRERGQVS